MLAIIIILQKHHVDNVYYCNAPTRYMARCRHIIKAAAAAYLEISPGGLFEEARLLPG